MDNTDSLSVWADGVITFTRLSRAYLMGAVPAWSSVRNGLKQLEQDDLAEDKRKKIESQVIEFSQLLKSCEPSIVAGLVLSSSLGRLVPNDQPSERLRRGLDAVDKWIPADAGSAEQCARKLSRHYHEFPSMLHANEREQAMLALGGRMDVPYSFDFRLLQKWFNEDAKGWPLSPNDANFASYSARICEYLFQKRRVRKPASPSEPAEVVPYLICEAAGLSVAQLLRPQLSKVTIGEWSQLVLLAMNFEEFRLDLGTDCNHHSIPLWIGAVGLMKLGFGQKLVTSFLQRLWPAIEKQEAKWNVFRKAESASQKLTESPGSLLRREFDLAAESSLNQQPPKRSASAVSEGADNLELDLIVCETHRESSRLAGFTPLPNHACLCVPQDVVLSFAKQLIRLDWPWRLRSVYLEDPPPDQSPHELMSVLAPLFQNSTRIVAVYRRLPSQSNFEWSRLRPKKLAELLNPQNA